MINANAESTAREPLASVPPCQKPHGHICRGCAGWRAMLEAARPGGPWHGLAVHCPACGLTLRPKS